MKLSTRLRTAAAGGAVLLMGAIAASPAGATGAYPGETLSLAQSTPATVGQATTIVAGGQQADVNDYAGGFDLEVFQKDPARDPTCAADYEGEKNTYGTELPAEKWIVIGQWQGMGTTFSVPFKANFDTPGPWLLCAYSTWTVDTAAVAQLTVDATGGSARQSRLIRDPGQAGQRQQATRQASGAAPDLPARHVVESAQPLRVPLAGGQPRQARRPRPAPERDAAPARAVGALHRHRRQRRREREGDQPALPRPLTQPGGLTSSTTS